ncbi:hypothetical protein [Actinospica robiniae]|uniref:hypothetical protein n=1 Tax=Actinospica robiniae TaxID=304901 RepID=UPI000422D525|nr:hypothetical protein [Actinospica robiniae]
MYAIEQRDLAPAGKATAIGVSTQMPVNEDGSTDYPRGDFRSGLVYGIDHA